MSRRVFATECQTLNPDLSRRLAPLQTETRHGHGNTRCHVPVSVGLSRGICSICSNVEHLGFSLAHWIYVGRVVTLCPSPQGGKKGGGGKEKKGSSIPQSGAPRPAPWRDPTVIMHNLLLIESFSRQVGR